MPCCIFLISNSSHSSFWLHQRMKNPTLQQQNIMMTQHDNHNEQLLMRQYIKWRHTLHASNVTVNSNDYGTKNRMLPPTYASSDESNGTPQNEAEPSPKSWLNTPTPYVPCTMNSSSRANGTPIWSYMGMTRTKRSVGREWIWQWESFATTWRWRLNGDSAVFIKIRSVVFYRGKGSFGWLVFGLNSNHCNDSSQRLS